MNKKSVALTPSQKKLGKALLEVNKIIPQPKGESELLDWTLDINRLMPNVEPEQVQLVFDAIKLGLLKWDTFAGIQNIYNGINETSLFWKLYSAECDFKKRRAEWIKENGKIAFYRLIIARYKNYIENALGVEASKRSASELNDLSNPKSHTRHIIRKAIFFSYNHPYFNKKHNELLDDHRFHESEYLNELVQINIRDVDFTIPKIIPAIDKYRQEQKRLNSNFFIMHYGEVYKYDLFDVGKQEAIPKNKPVFYKATEVSQNSDGGVVFYDYRDPAFISMAEYMRFKNGEVELSHFDKPRPV